MDELAKMLDNTPLTLKQQLRLVEIISLAGEVCSAHYDDGEKYKTAAELLYRASQILNR